MGQENVLGEVKGVFPPSAISTLALFVPMPGNRELVQISFGGNTPLKQHLRLRLRHQLRDCDIFDLNELIYKNIFNRYKTYKEYYLKI
jgi:hypothetical protein